MERERDGIDKSTTLGFVASAMEWVEQIDIEKEFNELVYLHDEGDIISMKFSLDKCLIVKREAVKNGLVVVVDSLGCRVNEDALIDIVTLVLKEKYRLFSMEKESKRFWASLIKE